MSKGLNSKSKTHPSVLVKQLVNAVDQFAPFRLAYDWDNVGLQVGNPEAEVKRVLVALEVNRRVIEFAQDNQCDVIISHHPLIFKALKSVKTGTETTNLISLLIKSDIALIAAHTNLDRVKNGTNGALAELIELRDPEILEPVCYRTNYNLVVFVPRDYTPKIIEAMHRGGGAVIGNYTHCTFRSSGTGTFRPVEGADPFTGDIGQLTEAAEDRLECIVSMENVSRVVTEIKQAHPYEEVAYNVYPLYDAETNYGLGLVGTIPSKTTLRQFAQNVRAACDAPFAHFAGDSSMPVKKVAIVSGSAGSVATSIRKETADVIVTGELSYHITMECIANGVGVIALGHAVSERVFAPYFCEQFSKTIEETHTGLEFISYTDFPEPWQVVQKMPKNAGKK